MKKFFSFIVITLVLFAGFGAEAMPIFSARGNTVCITYHLISENPKDWSAYCISPKMFEEDLKYLKNSGYEFITASQAVKRNFKNKKTAIITFDDGYSSDLKYAAPLLEKYGACATFFVTGGLVDTKGYLSSAELAELSKKKCVEIGNHSYILHNKNYSTISLMYGDAKYEKEIMDDFKKNSDFIKKITGKAPSALSYPNGIYSLRTDAKLKKEQGVVITFSTQEIAFRMNNQPVGRKNRGYERKIQNIVGNMV